VREVLILHLLTQTLEIIDEVKVASLDILIEPNLEDDA